MTKKGRVVCLGECMIEISGDGDCRKLGYAGDSLNIAVYMSRLLGPGKVSYATFLGDDQLSEEMIGFIRSEGIDTSMIEKKQGRLPGLYLVVAKGSNREFHYWRSEAPAREMLSTAGEKIESSLKSASILVVTGITMAILSDKARQRLCGLMSEAKGKVAYVLNQRSGLWPTDTSRPWHARAASLASLVFASREEMAEIWPNDTGLSEIGRRCEGEIIVTDGENGCMVYEKGKTKAFASSIKTEVVDTTAAGDSFAAAYLAGKLHGLGAQKCVDVATKLASAVVGQHGAIIDKDCMPDKVLD